MSLYMFELLYFRQNRALVLAEQGVSFLFERLILEAVPQPAKKPGHIFSCEAKTLFCTEENEMKLTCQKMR